MNNTLKIILSILFFLTGCCCAYLTYDMRNIVKHGHIKFDYGFTSDTPTPFAGAGGGVDSSDDGVAAGLGIIAGFSIFSSALLLNSLHKK